MKKRYSVLIALLIFLLFAVCKSGSLGHNAYFVSANKCTGCKACIRVCPVDAIVITNGTAYIDPKRCIECGKCVDECPEDAIY